MNELEQLMEDIRRRVNERTHGMSSPAPAIDPLAPSQAVRRRLDMGDPFILDGRPSFERVFEAVADEVDQQSVTSGDDGATEVAPPAQSPVDLKLPFDLPVLSLPPALAEPFPASGPALRRRLLELKDAYRVEEFLAFEDAEFVHSAYRGMLRREPDEAGYQSFLGALRAGQISKLGVLWRIHGSPEGRERNVHVRGLRWALRWEEARKLPLIGHWLGLVRAVFALPGLARKVAFLEGYWAESDRELRSALQQHHREMLAWTQRALALRDAQLAVLSQAATTRYALESMAGRLVDTGIATAQAAAHARELAQQVADMNGALARLGTGKLSADDFWEIHAETLKRFEELARDREAKRAATLAHIEALSRGHEASHGENVKRIEELARRGEASHAENVGRIEALAHGQQAARDESARRFSDLATAHEKILAAIDAAGAAHRQVEARVREIGEDLARKLGVDEFWAAQAEALSRAGKIAERLDRESQSLAAAIDAAKAELGDRFGVVERSAIRLLEEFRQGLDRAAADLEQLRGNEADRAAILSRLDREQRDSEARLAELQRLGSLTSENLTRLTAFVDEGTDLTHSIPDEFYFEFENRFRGTTEDIKHRVAIYAPVVKKAGAGTAKHPVADIGCGRGEWLDVLREKGLHALGIDINQTMVDLCVANGLGVVQADAVEYLRTRPQASLGAVTGIHIIEHLTFGRVLALLDACLAALKPGGVAIFETPNPENVLVGSCDFWYDPTHRAPLPPDMMRWVALSRGFARAEIMRLHPVGPEGQLRDGNEAVRTMLNERFNGPRDYAVVAYAPRARRK